MVRQITGLQGGGKTYTALRFIVLELCTTNRWIVTNLTEIKLPQLAQYLADTFPHLEIDLAKRLQIIPKSETIRWYRYRGAFTLPVFDFKNDPKTGKSTELPEDRDKRMELYFAMVYDRNSLYRSGGEEDRGVVYFLDEGHRHFRADSYAEFNHLASFYLTQLRHLNDVFWVLSQNSEQVVPAIRRLSFDTHYLRNHYLESFMFWKKPGGFAWAQFLGCPKWENMGSGRLESQDHGRVKLDLKLANCYYTKGALGGRSELAETKPHSKKLPLWTLWVGLGVACALVMFVFFQIPKAASWITHKVVGGFVGEGQKQASTLASAMAGAAPPSSSPRLSTKGSELVNYSSPRERDLPPREVVNKTSDSLQVGPVTVDFWLVRGSSIRVGFSSGVVVSELDRVVRSIDPTAVVLLDGRRIAYSKRVSRPTASIVVVHPDQSQRRMETEAQKSAQIEPEKASFEAPKKASFVQNRKSH